MPGEVHANLAIRPMPMSISIANSKARDGERRHKHSRSSYSEMSPLAASRNNSLTFRPAKRSMRTPDKTIAIINASGRQAASLIRVATAVGYHVRAQLRNTEGVIATEVATNPHVTLLEGELYTRHQEAEKRNVDLTQNGPLSGIGVNHALISELFQGAQLAFINTTFHGDEIRIGEAIADAAKAAGIQHYIYSSMPDHQHYDDDWPSLPLWASKHRVEEYVKKIGLPATFVYTGIYNNNFTSLPYPLFMMELQKDGSFTWQAPFHPDVKLPWLDAEHDVGPAILQIFKDGAKKWGNGRRVALAYEYLTPVEACRAFQRGVERPVRYIQGEIEIRVKIPDGYRIQLEALEELFGMGKDDPKKQPPYFGDAELEADCPRTAMELWEGPRGLEEYAREVFPLEEHANGLVWMLDDSDDAAGGHAGSGNGIGNGIGNGNGNTSAAAPSHRDDDSEAENDDGEDVLIMRGSKRDEEEWLA